MSDMFYFFAAVAVGIWLSNGAVSAWNRDDTDGPDGRSGLVVFVDHATNVQYVASHPFGALTVRLGPDGKPLLRVEGGEHAGQE